VVDLQRLTVLVGANGAGKSNFVDALAFGADCLNYSVELAFRHRGGIAAVRRRSGGHPTHIGFRFKLDLPGGGGADYAFEIAAKPREAFRVACERCRVHRMRRAEQSFEVRDGQFVKEVAGIRPRVEPDRLALTVTSAIEEFRPVYDILTHIRRYLISPEQIRSLQDPDPEEGKWLRADGSNAAAVLKRVSEDAERNGYIYERLCSLLARVVPGTKQVVHRSLGQKETLQFKQDVGLRDPWTFDALNMSDGTLRVLGVLLAVYQPSTPSWWYWTLMTIAQQNLVPRFLHERREPPPIYP
ncbi:MAG: AAA family ATPase, partial [Abditibacteriales bacterium]|nr:AAA family ATPase [Abditibacteriales bacterium]MDW8367236.1 AAA family ATPase [Abditibacteriales bacterium]